MTEEPIEQDEPVGEEVAEEVTESEEASPEAEVESQSEAVEEDGIKEEGEISNEVAPQNDQSEVVESIDEEVKQEDEVTPIHDEVEKMVSERGLRIVTISVPKNQVLEDGATSEEVEVIALQPAK